MFLSAMNSDNKLADRQQQDRCSLVVGMMPDSQGYCNDAFQSDEVAHFNTSKYQHNHQENHDFELEIPNEQETYRSFDSATLRLDREHLEERISGHHCLDDDGEAGQGGLSVASSQSDHCHTPKPGNRASRKAMTKLIVACCLTTLFMIGEAVGGYLANSIAIMSDAAHLLSDLTSFIVSLVAIFIGMQPASRKMNFGYHRAEVLGAVVSVLMIWLITGILVYAAVERVTSMDFEVESDVMIIVSALGVVINIILGVVLHTGSGGHGHSHGGHGHSHGASSEQQSSGSNTNVNVRAAFIHIIGDLLQSIGVLIAAYVIKFYPDYKIADPICTFIFSVLVIVTTIPIMRDLSHVLMEGTPHGIDYATVSNNLMTIQGVKMVHSLNIWALTLDKNACSVHLAISAESDHDTVLRDAQRVIRSRHQIYQTTIQVERYEPLQMDSCQQCQPLSK
ncbi:proton-coupled zinc antiporter SLC30A2-like isoform X2 [Palaemon carinicauda]|uniref:proton-coupled zinc antiporter SLC30A2-like isoform X2 n=1 Tax=Palaemon carinicauda TaxID=392227 RepID=UPI0035B5E240